MVKIRLRCNHSLSPKPPHKWVGDKSKVEDIATGVRKTMGNRKFRRPGEWSKRILEPRACPTLKMFQRNQCFQVRKDPLKNSGVTQMIL